MATSVLGGIVCYGKDYHAEYERDPRAQLVVVREEIFVHQPPCALQNDMTAKAIIIANTT